MFFDYQFDCAQRHTNHGIADAGTRVFRTASPGSPHYVKNTTEVDLINLPAFKIGPPTSQHNWRYNPRDKISEVNSVHELLPQLKEAGLTGEDLVTTFVSRRVSPLQRRVHKIFHMSVPLDPTRTSTFELTKEQVRRRIKAIATVQMSVEWEWGLEPHSRNNLPPAVSHVKYLQT